VAALLLAAALGLQWRSGAYSAALDGFPDESGHFLTGLMIRDYVADGFPAGPRTFAERYYVHYPRISFGHWPPLFHLIEAAWLLVFPVGRGPVLALMALFTAGAAFLVYLFLEKDTGVLVGAWSALLFTAMPVVREYSAMVMPEGLVALLCLGATCAFARYLRTEKARDAALFGVLATLAILTKANGWLLAGIPPLAIAATGKWRLLRKLSFWIPPAIVLPTAGAWYAATFETAQQGWTGSTNPQFLMSSVFGYNVTAVVRMGGAGILILALFGLVVSRRFAGRDAYVVCAVLALAALVFHSFVAPVRADRHLITAAPTIAIFAGAGTHWIAAKLGRFAFVTVVLGAVLFLAGTPDAPPKQRSGLTELAAFLDAQGDLQRGPVLIHSEFPGAEGAFVAEVAVRDRRRPEYMVVRDSNWLSSATTAGGLLDEMEAEGIHVLVLDPRGPRRSAEHHLLDEAPPAGPDRALPIWGDAAHIRAYRLLRALAAPTEKIRLDVRRSLGKILK
jgi:hypothetical protein